MESVASILRRNNGQGPGFESMRVLLALTVLLGHSYVVCYGDDSADTTIAVYPFFIAVLPMFFCMGGFLVAGSALRVKSFKTFVIFRLLRIVPAMAVEVFLSGIVLGGWMTTYPLSKYYTHPRFFEYFGNIIGDLRMTLPGVFENHPDVMVNTNLWTVPPEYCCCGIMAVIMICGLLEKRWDYAFLFLIATAVIAFLLPEINWGIKIYAMADEYMISYGFFAGTVAFLFAEYIPINKYLFILCAVLTYVFFSHFYMLFLGMLPVTYCTIYLGMMPIPRIPFLNKGDYSYGIYLYGYPIQQTIWHFFPFARSWLTLSLLAVPTTILFAMASWHIIEKRSLALKRYFLQTPYMPYGDR